MTSLDTTRDIITVRLCMTTRLWVCACASGRNCSWITEQQLLSPAHPELCVCCREEGDNRMMRIVYRRGNSLQPCVCPHLCSSASLSSSLSFLLPFLSWITHLFIISVTYHLFNKNLYTMTVCQSCTHQSAVIRLLVYVLNLQNTHSKKPQKIFFKTLNYTFKQKNVILNM